MTVDQNVADRADRVAEINTMRSDGMSMLAIARRIGVSRSRIYQLLAAELVRVDERAAHERFAMLPADLAVRLAERFPDEDAVCRAGDDELLSLRALGPHQLQKLRRGYPHRVTTA